MLVTTAMSGTTDRKVPSLSSASTTSHSPSSHTALVPISLTSPPMRKEGWTPASTSWRASIDAVVVFPWVPATAMHRRNEVSAARVSARERTGMPRRCASTRSGLSAPTAEETVTRSAPPTWPAWWPMSTGMPACPSRSVTAEAFRSLPVTVWPMACSAVAMALMPAPPMPTTCTVSGRVGSPKSGPGPGLIGPPSRPGRRHSTRPAGPRRRRRRAGPATGRTGPWRRVPRDPPAWCRA